jgi:hypothetical protein
VEREAGAALAEVPGAHVGYFDHVREVAALDLRTLAEEQW